MKKAITLGKVSMWEVHYAIAEALTPRMYETCLRLLYKILKDHGEMLTSGNSTIDKVTALIGCGPEKIAFNGTDKWEDRVRRAI